MKIIVIISANVGPTNAGSGGASGAVAETVCGSTCSKCACCGCTLREAAARHEQRVAANERLERANLEWKQVREYWFKHNHFLPLNPDI